MSGDANAVIDIAGRFGVPAVLLIALIIGIKRILVWAAPHVSGFLTALTDELKAMTKAMNDQSAKHDVHHEATMTRLDALGARVDARMDAMEARVRENQTAVAVTLEREVRDSVDRTGEHIAMTMHEAITAVAARQPTNPDLPAYVGDRQSPTPPAFVRPIPQRPPSQPGREPSPREGSRPSWERPGRPE